MAHPSTPPDSQESPWRSNTAWADGVVRDDMRIMNLVIGIATVFFVVMTFLPVQDSIRRLFDHPAADLNTWLALLILLGMDLLFIGVAGYLILLSKKFGASRLELSTFPGAIGGKLAGTIVIAKPVQFISELHVTLTCMKLAGYRGSGDSALWHGEQTLTNNLPSQNNQTRIPIYFEIPSHCSPTQHDKSHIRWRLKVHSPMPGVDYYASFLVPVFKVNQNDPVLDHAREYRVTDPSPADPAPLPPRGRGVSRSIDEPGAVHYSFAAARHPLVALQYTFFASIFAAMPVALWYYNMGRGAIITFGIILGLIALIVGISAWGMWFCFSQLTIRNQSLKLKRGQFFFSRTLQFDASEIQHISVTKTWESSSNAWYALELRTDKKGHRYVTIADGLSKRDADGCARELKKGLGLGTSKPASLTR